MMKETDTLTIAIKAVKESGLFGVTSIDITKTTGVPNNRVTAALVRAFRFGCVQRKKTYGSNARYRYTYVRDATREDFERESKVKGEPVTLTLPPVREPVPIAALKPPAAVAASLDRAVLISLNIPDRTPVYVSVKEARAVHQQLSALFGG